MVWVIPFKRILGLGFRVRVTGLYRGLDNGYMCVNIYIYVEGLYWDNGKENRNCYSGFRVVTRWVLLHKAYVTGKLATGHFLTYLGTEEGWTHS